MTDDAVHIWHVRIDPPDAALPDLLADLSPEERAHADRFRFARDRNRYIGAHAALRRILAAALGLPPTDVRIDGSAGKPCLAPGQGSTLQFNLSHSAGTALVAIHRNAPVGIDVEAVRLPNQYLSIAARYFGDAAAQALERAPESEKASAFTRLWVRFEALMKAQGTGIVSGAALPDALISCDLRDLPVSAIEADGWTVYDLAVPPGTTAAALACAGTVREIVVSDFAL